MAILRYVVANPGDEAVAATIAGSLPNFPGTDGSKEAPGAKGNHNTYRAGEGIVRHLHGGRGSGDDGRAYGTLALAVVG